MIEQTITGKLLDDYGLPITNWPVNIFKKDSARVVHVHIDTVFTDLAGTWRINLAPGTYTAEFLNGHKWISKNFTITLSPIRKFSAQDYRDIKEK